MSAANGWPKSAVELGELRYQSLAWGHCQSCHARVLWVTTPTKRDLFGKVVEGGKTTPLVEVPAPDGAPAGRYFQSHFSDCPNAGAHRSPR